MTLTVPDTGGPGPAPRGLSIPLADLPALLEDLPAVAARVAALPGSEGLTTRELALAGLADPAGWPGYWMGLVFDHARCRPPPRRYGALAVISLFTLLDPGTWEGPVSVPEVMAHGCQGMTDRAVRLSLNWARGEGLLVRARPRHPLGNGHVDWLATIPVP